ncbi:alpha-2-macroglobulin family protein [Flavisphingomonas formosensis]|uniref:alpha-2-macroglobulin family protein n=1 Tax=Flavisphingomonas formosensis TaxID=861534 RepID=UPI0012FAF61D|nr:MG2 domain-containing protein [Sphingomonas formosensis]
MRDWLIRLAVMALALGPVAASGDTAPQVVMATPGTGDYGTIDRFTVRFSDAMVPLGDPRAQGPFAVSCPTGGTGRWTDQTTYVYEFEKPLPGGVTCAFTLRPGLASVNGLAVTGQNRFTVDTGGPTARAVLPSRYNGDIEEDQVFLVAANVRADPASVAANAYCAVDGIGEKIAVDLLPADTAGKVIDGLGGQWQAREFLSQAGLPEKLPAAAGDKARATSSIVALKCRRPLPPGRDMALVWGAGIKGAGGRTAGADQRFDFTVRKAFEARFECSRVNPQAGCSPVEAAWLRFTAPIATSLAKQIRLDVGNGKTIAPTLSASSDDDEERGDARTSATVTEVKFAAPLPEAITARVLLPGGVKDESGRPLANAQRFPLDVRIDQAPPLVKFAAPFGIIEAGDPVLPVTVRNVEPALAGKLAGVGGKVARVAASDGAVANWLRTIAKANENDFREEKHGGQSVTVNHTGDASILTAQGNASPLNLALPGQGKAFEVVGIPLKSPGFYVVELASPRLGKALLGRNAPRYVSAGALVTNMAVHFKWGRAASLAWVTALDSGKPVAGAQVAVTDSCSGRTLARGTTDGTGRLLIPAGGLPEPQTYSSCDDKDNHALMVSARKADDFSFTLTDWGEGIRPYDFDLSFGYEKASNILHTVFDRTLLRAGETVNMKHILRRPIATGFTYAGALKGTLRLSHRGSDTQFEMPFLIGVDGIGATTWAAPKGAPLGDYDLSFIIGDKTIYSSQSIRVDEYRLPTMRATVTGPKQPAVRPTSMPLDLYVGYLSGGGAASLPVSIRTAFSTNYESPRGWDGWTFGGRAVKEGTEPLDGDNNAITPPLPNAQTLPVTLDSQGTGRTTVDIPQAIDDPTLMTVEMDYQDANGETLTASRRIPLYPSAVRLGIKTDGWMMKADDLRLKLVAIDPEGHPIRGQKISVALYSREILSARRRLIGGFYAYDNNAKTTKIDANCSARTDEMGLASCAIDPAVSGEVYAVATTTDENGNVARAVTSVWLAGADDWWFGGDNGDRMDLIPERKDYKAGETARFQVRMPFRSATALVTVEREGVLSSFVTELSGKDPVVEVKMPGSYAPDVYVSVMAVRGRIAGWRLWLADFARRWHLPFFSREGARPTALVDLAKPSYRIGMAEVNVGWESHQLAVEVKADKPKYRVRDTAEVQVSVRGEGGKPPAQAEIAFAAVDEALLQLQPNPSWKLIDAMMGDRPLSVLTSTAQTQVVGKRHYGRKAVAAGGGGGGDMAAMNREDFRPVLLWKARVPLDATGHARIAVPLSDSLSSFKLVAIATAGANRFGTGDLSIRTTQDLSIYSGVPPVVRTGDFYGASFTLRNGSDRPMTVTANAETMPRIGRAPPLTVTIPPGGAAPVTWHVPAPAGVGQVTWKVNARTADGRNADAMTAMQTIVPAVPVETWAATLARVGEQGPLPITPPAGALPGRGAVDIRLTDTLAPPLAGVRDYMAAYPYGCFEQRLSKAVVAGDLGAWTRLAGDMPTYLDGDGLLRYFPGDTLQGSPELTAYALSITAEAGFPVPEGGRARMIEALKGVVDGRIDRTSDYGGDKRFLKVAALAALARNGASTPELLGQAGIAPNEMPTAVLAEWMAAIDRTKGANPALRQQAEAVLRTRITYEGARLDLTDTADPPWWMMISGDEMAIKALLAVLGRPGWQQEGPRMMIGIATRQQRGHWDTTPANAWGTILARRFASIYPATAIAGTTTASLGAASRSQSWPMPANAAPLSLALPRSATPLLLSQSGGAGPWAMVSVRAAVPLTQPFFGGYRITREVSVLQRRKPGQLTRGDVLKVRITVEANAARSWVVINDPIPAGATIVGGLGGQSQILSDKASGGDGWSPSYIERSQEAWRAYFNWLPRGKATVEYAVRLNGVGTFQMPPTRVEAMYSPQIRGALPNRPVTVAMR